jgi:hypothetical protein
MLPQLRLNQTILYRLIHDDDIDNDDDYLTIIEEVDHIDDIMMLMTIQMMMNKHRWNNHRIETMKVIQTLSKRFAIDFIDIFLVYDCKMFLRLQQAM